MVHCDKRGSEIIIGNWSHVFKYEQGSAAQIAGVFVQNVPNLPDGTFSIDAVRENLRGGDIHEPITQLVVIEQTHNMSGGRVVPLEWIEELSKVCRDGKVAVHMDGARIFNAAEYLKVPLARVARDVDSVSFCLSKNLCCPVGSMLCGTKQFVDKARRLRKALGGGMRQAGFLAAAGLCAFETIVPRLGDDHRHTRELAQAIDNLKSSIFQVDLKGLQTNILMIKVIENSKNLSALDLSNRLAEVKDYEVKEGICDSEQKPIVIKSSCKNLSTLRVVFYHQINDEVTQLAIKKVLCAIKDLEQ
jgi:threonine aldolase